MSGAESELREFQDGEMRDTAQEFTNNNNYSRAAGLNDGALVNVGAVKGVPKTASSR